MANPNAHPGTGPLTPSEVAFLCESQSITIIPRQRLDRLDFIAGSLPPFHPPQRATVPLWLALLLKRQRRCNIVPPAWLTTAHLEEVLMAETEDPKFSPDLPFRWLETAEMLLDACPDDLSSGDAGGGSQDLRVLLRSLREIRQTKAREGLKSLQSTYLHMNNLGLLEITELRGFAKGVMDNLRKIEASREETRRNREEEENEAGGRYRGSTGVEMDEDED